MKAYRDIVTKVGCVMALTAVFAIASASRADAAAMLRLTQGVNTITITDNGAGDLNPATNVVTWSGTIGVFNTNVTTGLTKDQAVPEIMHLNSVDHSTRAGDLKIEFTDDTFLVAHPAITMLFSATSGSPAGQMTYKAYFDTTNTSFGEPAGGLINTITGGPGPFAATASGPGPTAVPYSLTQVVTIHHSAAATSSFDASLVPEPASLTLFSMALLGAGAAIRRRKQQATPLA